MRIIADLQIHSKYSRACSQDLAPDNIAAWADRKGVDIVGTGDFTHPKWLELLKDELADAEPGLYRHKGVKAKARFLLTAEVSNIYKQGDKVRRVHNMLFAPDFLAVERIIAGLKKRGANLNADGRPIMGIHCDDLVKIVKEADERNEIIPAHAWTPHFGLFGSLSGFDSVKEAFGDQARHIFAIETGLSSDPKMNWQISSLDQYALLSNSDAHSLRKIGREANAFQVDQKKLSYSEIIRIIKSNDPSEFLYTIEFFPEEGKYHLDGHRDCKFSCLPAQTVRLGGVCPVCRKKLLVGVLSRVNELADREYGFQPERRIPFRNVIPLEEIIAETFGVGAASKKVQSLYDRMTDGASHTEFGILLDMDRSQIASISNPALAEAVMRVRDGKVNLEAGYDGVFGKIHIFDEPERKRLLDNSWQSTLF